GIDVRKPDQRLRWEFCAGCRQACELGWRQRANSRTRPHEPRKNCQERWLRAGRRKPRETACGPLTNVREKKVWLRTPERESSCASPRQTPHRKTVTMIPAALYDVMRCKQASKIDFLKEPAYRMGKADCEEPNIQRRLSSLIGGIETGTVRARSAVACRAAKHRQTFRWPDQRL